MKRTKIVCTIGPASADKRVLSQMVKNGMNVARLAFSHGSYESHASLLKTIRDVSLTLNEPIAIMQDLQGPRIRTGAVPEAGIPLKKGEVVAVVSEKVYNKQKKTSTEKWIPMQYPELYKSVKNGHHILIHDGLIQLLVTKVVDDRIYCKVHTPGVIFTHKGINLPDSFIKGSVITEKDKKDLAFGVKQGVDYVAISFVKNGDDIIELRNILAKLEKRKTPKTKIIAKVERQEAIHNFDEILSESDGIMVARGDLGIELDPEDVPLLQKGFILKCIAASKPVIVATQMLESMMTNPRPTRAEVSDIANAVIDHTDATMLSGETTVGQYPVDAVNMMARVHIKTEHSAFDNFDYENFEYKEDMIRSMSVFLCSLAKNIYEHNVKSIVLRVNSDIVPRFMSSLRMERDVIAITTDSKLYHQMSLLWGVRPLLVSPLTKMSAKACFKAAIENGLAKDKTAMLYMDEERLRVQEKSYAFEVYDKRK